MEQYLLSWLESISSESIPSSLRSAVFHSGIETVFNVDILRASKQDNIIDSNLASLSDVPPDSATKNLPRLLSAYAQNVRKYRSSLFGQGSNQAPGASLLAARQAGMRFFASCDSLCQKAAHTELAWETRLSLLRALDEEALYVMNDQDMESLLRTVGDQTISMLSTAIHG